ncbi:IclR family transcriptional regulator [Paenarthrobacter sp. NPDC091669]|uniref:IclR family transcriptional regulator n=1 Tax=Paenarthrobacter sp. NPDC091669 TaxID=3364384 RepID=UPI0037FA3331
MGRVADVMGAFDTRHSELTLAQITHHAGLAHATARRLVKELCAARFLAQTPHGTYVVGIRLWEIGALAPSSLPLRRIAMPYMQVLHDSLREHVQLVVRDGNEGLIVERLSGPRTMKLVSRPGGRLPLHTSAAGKVLLAYAPPETLNQVLDGHLAEHTPKSITDSDALRSELAAVRSNGHATVRGEMPPVEANSVAAGIFGREGDIIAAMSVVVPSSRGSLQPLIPAVMSAARAVTTTLRSGR